jgi:hypothetical protein
MRNISLTATTITSLPQTNLTSTTIDVDENVLYAASERQDLDADVQVSIWKIPLTGEDRAEKQVSYNTFFEMSGKCIFGNYQTVFLIIKTSLLGLSTVHTHEFLYGRFNYILTCSTNIIISSSPRNPLSGSDHAWR